MRVDEGLCGRGLCGREEMWTRMWTRSYVDEGYAWRVEGCGGACASSLRSLWAAMRCEGAREGEGRSQDDHARKVVMHVG